jgi:LmbE family N-acetylglucosaminyl deacetylase
MTKFKPMPKPKPRPPTSVVVLAPHPDDEVLGCGGALCRHAAAGDRIVVVFLTSGELGLKRLAREDAWRIREDEARAAARILGIAAVEFLRGPDWGLKEARPTLAPAVRDTLLCEQPRVIYLPHPGDGHPDHQAVLPLLRRALGRRRRAVPELRAFEVWTPLPSYDQVVDITEQMPRKLKALRAHRSQLGEFDYIRAITGLNQYRGLLAARRPYAEVFQTIAL